MSRRNRRVGLDEIAGEIALAVSDYTSEVSEAVAKEIDDTSKAVIKDVKANSPVSPGGGGYKKGWRRKKHKQDGMVAITIHNANKPWLAHLLEKGHGTRSGGYVEGKPHMVPAYDTHVPAMEKRIEEIIKRGG